MGSIAEYKKTLEKYVITPENLYVLFCDMQESAEILGYQISQSFVLASEGQMGVDEIKKENSEAIACSSFSSLERIKKEMQESLVFEIDKKKLGGLLKPSTFIILLAPKNEKQQIKGIRVISYSSKKALDWAEKNYKNYIPLISGTEEDFDFIIFEMKKILKEQDFESIVFDCRDKTNSFSNSLLLNSKKKPESIDLHYFVSSEL